MQNSILQEVLKISAKERVALAEVILASIDNENSEINELWISEVQKRMQSVVDGESIIMDFNAKYVTD